MNVFLQPRWRVIFDVLLLIWLVVVAGIGLSGLRQTFPLPVSEIRHNGGCAYLIALHPRPVGWPITVFVSDSLSAKTDSGLKLFENGHPIGESHALHDEIRTKGAGLYSHWRGNLFFSTSDCSDPRTNGKQYSVTLPLELSRWALASSFIAIIFLGAIVTTHFAPPQQVRRITRITRDAFSAVFSPFHLYQRPILSSFILLILVVSAGVFLRGIWDAGISTHMTVGGFYQISDASNWWFCSNALVDKGTFGNPNITGDWCHHRAIYPTFLSGIALLGGRTMVGTLLWQALLVSFAMFVFLRRSASYIGVVGAILCRGFAIPICNRPFIPPHHDRKYRLEPWLHRVCRFAQGD